LRGDVLQHNATFVALLFGSLRRRLSVGLVVQLLFAGQILGEVLRGFL